MQFAATLLECLIPSNALFIRILLGTLLHNWMCSIDIYIFFFPGTRKDIVEDYI